MFGFGRGKIKFELPKYNFTAGETIDGVVHIKLKKPIEGNGFFIRLYGEKKIRTHSGGKTRYRTEKIYDFEQPLDGEKQYLDQPFSYKFQIAIPGDVSNQTMPEGALGQIAKTLQAFSQHTTRIKWYIQARLDIPKAIDMREKIQVNIT